MPHKIANIFLSFFRNSLLWIGNAYTIGDNWEDAEGNPGFTIFLEGKKYDVTVKVRD